MNSRILIAISLFCAAAATTTFAAPPPGGMGGMGAGMPKPIKISPALAKVFGEHTTFTADIETETSAQPDMKLPGKIASDKGKTRTEIDLTQVKGGPITPEMAASIKTMGMDRMITIVLPEKRTSYMIYPGMEAYVETQDDPADKSKPEDLKVKTQDLGKDTLDGHPVLKNKVLITEATNEVMNATVWNATDLKNFPIKIEHESDGNKLTTSFKNVKFDKPAAAQFEIPANYKKYSGMMELMQAMVMKQMGGMSMPPQAQPNNP